MKGSLAPLWRLILILAAGWLPHNGWSQTEKGTILRHLDRLSAPDMDGRGYYHRGDYKAALYIRDQLMEMGLSPLPGDTGYFQPYAFPVNRFEGRISLKLNGKELKPGLDYLVDAAACGGKWKSRRPSVHSLASVRDTAAWESLRSEFRPGEVHILRDFDTAARHLGWTLRSTPGQFPQGLFLIPRSKRMIWLGRTDQKPTNIIYIEDAVFPDTLRRVKARIESEWVARYPSQNVMAFVPGTRNPDSFLVFTAHYDHLGRMGEKALFAGAHDNASGTALSLSLAEQVARNPAPYSVAFLFFSGEELGLLGSEYFCDHPLIPLENIRMVINLDMTADAEQGITVIGGKEEKQAFSLLETLNRGRLPEIRPRELTRNSDHYSFARKSVPAIFIYANGNNPHYHHVNDTPDQVRLNRIHHLGDLLTEFIHVFPRSVH